MLKLGRRLMSNWANGYAESLVESLSGLINESPKDARSIIVTGPQGSGKSIGINMAFDLLENSANFHEKMLAGAKVSVLAEESAPTAYLVTESLNESIAEVIKYLEEKTLDQPRKQDLKEKMLKHAEKLGSLPQTEEVTKEQVKEGINAINSKITEYQQVIRLNSINTSGLSHIIDKVSVADAFRVLFSAYNFGFVENDLGEHSAPFIVEMLNYIGEICAKDSQAPPLLLLEDSHLFFMESMSYSFLHKLLENVAEQRQNFHFLIEGAGIFSSCLSLVNKHSQAFDWINVLDMPKEQVFAFLGENTENKEAYWESSGGNIEILNSIVEAVAAKEYSVEGIKKEILSNTVKGINERMKEFAENEEDMSLTDKLINLDQVQQRSIAYALDNLMMEKDYTLEISLEDFANNFVLQQLCILRILYFNSFTQTLSFDKSMIPSVIKSTDIWKFNRGSIEKFKNKRAYQKVLKMAQDLD